MSGRSYTWFVLVGMAILATLVPAAAEAEVDQKQVLVLYSTRRDTQLAVVGDRDMPRILGEGLPVGVDYYSEYLDRARFPDAQYQLAFHDYLKLKYQGVRFDLVVAMQDLALEFTTRYRDELFPGTPVVYHATSRSATQLANSAGIIEIRDFGRTIRLAAGLQPETSQVFVVSGHARRDKVYEEWARSQFRAFEPRLSFTYLSGLTTAELERRIAALPPRSIIFYTIVYQTGDGENVNPIEYLDRIAKAANRPIYTWVDSGMGHGILGGSLLSQDSQVRSVAGLAVRVLRGESADSIRTETADLNVDQVDWRQLRRWNISEARLPAGTLIQFRDLGVWARYRVYIISAAVLLLAQSALIAGLVVQRARRRLAEGEMRASRAQLDSSYDRIRDLASRLLNAQEAERSRIARELHDDISQKIALVAIDLQVLSGFTGPSPGVKTPLGKVSDRVQDIAASIHELSHRLHPATLALTGLVPALRGLPQDFASADVDVAFAYDGVPIPALPPDITLTVFRVAQEAVQNAVRHSGASAVAVHLQSGPSGLTLRVTDEGAGFDVDAALGKGLGLISMRERVEAIHATLTIRSRPGEGTSVELVVPEVAVAEHQSVAV